MSTLTVWPRGALTACEEYWNFRDHCEHVYLNLYGREPAGGTGSGFRDIMQDELYKWGGRLTDHHECIDFESDRHRTMWLLRWSSK